jgi:magnesium transporter
MITSRLCAADGIVSYDLTAEQMRVALSEPTALLWVDIGTDNRAEGEPLLRDLFKFHPLTVDDCFNTLIDPPKIDDYVDYLFVIVHEVQYEAEARHLSTHELDMFIGPNYVVSVHREPLRVIEELRRRGENHALAFTRGADFLAHALMDVVVDDFHPVVEALDEQVVAVEERVLDAPERPLLQEVLQLKRVAQRLKRSILPQRDVANRFSRGEYSHLIRTESLMYFRDVYDHTVRVEDMIDSLRDLADSTLNTYLSSVNNRLNEVMKTLAIVTVVFLPLTLIAGIYGTNFDNVPEYDWRLGYPAMIAGMLTLAGALVAWFRWRRWF